MSCGFGEVARIGHLYPSGGLCDHEVQMMAPDGVQFLTTRLPFRDTSIASDKALIDDLESHAMLLADARVDLIALNCTAAGVVAGPDEINRRVQAATGIRSVTTIQAVMAALSAVNATRIALMTPYRREVVEAETAFFEKQGLRIVAEKSLPQPTPYDQGMLHPHRWLELAATLDGPFDALVISCAGIRLAGVIERLEALVNKPVIASNAALLWYCLKTLNIVQKPKHYGNLLEGAFDA